MVQKIFLNIFKDIISLNYYICLFTTIGATILYIFNFKKAGKIIPFSLGLYILTQALSEALI